MGKRIGSQLTQTELVVVTLGAAIGGPMQAPDKGMLPALLILAIAVGFQRGVWVEARLGVRDRTPLR